MYVIPIHLLKIFIYLFVCLIDFCCVEPLLLCIYFWLCFVWVNVISFPQINRFRMYFFLFTLVTWCLHLIPCCLSCIILESLHLNPFQFYGRIVQQFKIQHHCFKSVHTAKLSSAPERWVSPAELRCWHTHNENVQVLMLQTLNDCKKGMLILYK